MALQNNFKPKLIDPKHLKVGRFKTPIGEYEEVKFGGKNTSGITPIGDRVLVKPDSCPQYSDGGIEFTEQQRERITEAAESGVLVAAGDAAWFWNSDRSRPYTGSKPQVGQRVWFERYTGSKQYGRDGELYRIMDDKCIGALAE